MGACEHRIYVKHGGLLSANQLRHYFAEYGEILDVYFPEDPSGNGKSFAFVTFATRSAMSGVLEPPWHLIERTPVQASSRTRSATKSAGPPSTLTLQVKIAHKRTGETSVTHSQCSAATPPKQQYGVGPRLYVASPDALAMDQVRNYFSHWGRVLDVYFPAGSRSRHGSYCFVTFESYHSAHQAWAQAERRIGSQPLNSISIAEDRNIRPHPAVPNAQTQDTSSLVHIPALLANRWMGQLTIAELMAHDLIIAEDHESNHILQREVTAQNYVDAWLQAS